MRERFAGLAEQLAAMSLRERALILGAATALMLVAWDGVVLRPWQAERELARSGAAELRGEIATLEQRASDVAEQLETDPHADLRAQIGSLRSAVAELDVELERHGHDLVGPAQMTSVLEALLSSRPALHVVRLEGLPAVPLFEGGESAAPAVGESSESKRVYRHGLRIELDATFADTLAFLREMERLPQRFFWEALQYEVTEHPRAHISLEVHTLSEWEGWIGA